MIWNPDQRALIQWITAGLKIKEVRDLKKRLGYLLSNMIAKVTLANSEYFISNDALKLIHQMNVDLKKHTKERKVLWKKTTICL